MLDDLLRFNFSISKQCVHKPYTDQLFEHLGMWCVVICENRRYLLNLNETFLPTVFTVQFSFRFCCYSLVNRIRVQYRCV